MEKLIEKVMDSEMSFVAFTVIGVLITLAICVL